MKKVNFDRRNRFIRKQLNRMQDFEYEFSSYDLLDFEKKERDLIRKYGLGELNINYFDYYERLNNG